MNRKVQLNPLPKGIWTKVVKKKSLNEHKDERTDGLLDKLARSLHLDSEHGFFELIPILLRTNHVILQGINH